MANKLDKKTNNSERRMLAIRRLQRLIQVLEQPDFSGSARVEVYAYQGKLGKIRSTVDEIDEIPR